ncbi:molybdopterin-dependent oxidoreductase [Acidimangrovimonas sediminis]|uniref:molybdopterin-dependent oxidoreductase n=1 Tax=Acidimangrovimonas sediminis TaxID=2056283 RepID=UPI000C8023A0|nr:molybdopterin-dependent oxidoreductase [Acidimangrovimonas sediminis]
MRYSAAHWGIYEIHGSDNAPKLRPFRKDPDASPIGLHQMAPELAALRVRRPAIRRSWLEGGPGGRGDLRGRDSFVEVSWDEAVGHVAAELTRVRATHGNRAIFGGSYGWASAGRFHHAQSQLKRFLNCVGGFVAHKTSYSLGAGHTLLPHVVAPLTDLFKQHTSWDVLADHCTLFVSFGGVPAKNTQVASGGAARHRCREGLRNMAASGTRFVNFSPVADNLDTGGPVEWIPIRPGTDTAVMLALAHEIVAAGAEDREFLSRCCTGWDRFLPYLQGATDGCAKTADWAAEISGVPAARIRTLAQEMTAHRTMINCAWALQRAEHGEQPFWMTIVLAAILGQIGLPGGGFGLGYGAENSIGSPHVALSGPTLSQGVNPVADFIPVARIADMLLNPGAAFTYDGARLTYPDIRLVWWAGGNPFHHHQDLGRLERAWQKPETIIVNEPFWTPTARRADIVLPATTPLEREDLSYATLEGVLVASRQVQPPLAGALDDHEIFRRVARVMGVEDAFAEGRSSAEWLRHLYDETRRRWQAQGIAMPEYDAFLQEGILDLSDRDERRVMLQAFRADPEGAPLPTPSGRIEIFSDRIDGFGLADCKGHPAWFAPDEALSGPRAQEFPLHLISDQPVRRLHSQLDASPHSVAGKIAGREPVSMHPQDASARGLQHGDAVEIWNGRGLCVSIVRVTPEVMPGVVKLSTGAWYDPDPATGHERHGNPNALTADRGASGLSQGCGAQSCLVDVRKLDAEAAGADPFRLPEFDLTDR